jgi:hypothetical protein
MIEYSQEYQRLDGKEAKKFANLTFEKFRWLEAWGPAGALQQGDITYTTWKRLQPLERSSFGFRLSRQYEMLDLEFLCELGKRHAIANAALSNFSASARLNFLAQPSAAFDRFLAVAREQDRTRAEDVRNAIVQSNTFPRPVWLGSAPNG